MSCSALKPTVAEVPASVCAAVRASLDSARSGSARQPAKSVARVSTRPWLSFR